MDRYVKGEFDMNKIVIRVVSLVAVLTLFFVSTLQAIAAPVNKNNGLQKTEKKANLKLETSKNVKFEKSELILKYKKNTKSNLKKQIEDDMNLELIDTNKNGDRLLKSDKKDLAKVIKNLRENKDIEYVAYNYIRQATDFPDTDPDDEKFADQWGLKAVNALEAWKTISKNENLKEIKVAVIDTGIDFAHDDLKGNF